MVVILQNIFYIFDMRVNISYNRKIQDDLNFEAVACEKTNFGR